LLALPATAATTTTVRVVAILKNHQTQHQESQDRSENNRYPTSF
jgi:hypothetical protein